MQTKVVKRIIAPRKVGRKPSKGPKAVKLAVSFEAKLAKSIMRQARQRTGGNISAWLAVAAVDRLRHESMEAALRWMEEKNGPSTPEELAEVDRLWPKD